MYGVSHVYRHMGPNTYKIPIKKRKLFLHYPLSYSRSNSNMNSSAGTAASTSQEGDDEEIDKTNNAALTGTDPGTRTQRIDDITLAKMHMRAKALASAKWENTSHVHPSITNDYRWSKRIMARFKTGLLEQEARILRKAKRSKKRKRGDDSSDEDDFESLVERTHSSKLTWLELDRAPSLEFITQEQAYRLPSRALTELAEVTAEERKTLVLQTPVIPHQYSFTAIGSRKMPKQVHALRQVSQSLTQATRLMAYGLNELLWDFSYNDKKGVSPVTVRRAAESLFAALDTINNQVRITNVAALRGSGAKEEVFRALSHHDTPGLSKPLGHIAQFALKDQRENAKNWPQATNSTRGGGRGGQSKRRKDFRRNNRPNINRDNDNSGGNLNNLNNQDKQPNRIQQPSQTPKNPAKRSGGPVNRHGGKK